MAETTPAGAARMIAQAVYAALDDADIGIASRGRFLRVFNRKLEELLEQADGAYSVPKRSTEMSD